MNDKRLRTNDLKLLSAYLDDELTTPQRQNLEERLGRSPALREKLNILRRTKLILGSLPRLKAPRSFTLTPEMVAVKHRKQPPVFNALRLASSIAGILLVALVGIELIWGGGFGKIMMASQASVADSETLSYDTTMETMITVGESETDNATGMDEDSEEGAYTTEDEVVEELEMEEEVIVEEEFEIDIQSEEVEESEVETSKAAEETVEESSIPDSGAGEDGEVLDRGESTTAEEDDTQATRLSAIRWAQISLAVIVAGGLITLWILRRKRQP